MLLFTLKKSFYASRSRTSDFKCIWVLCCLNMRTSSLITIWEQLKVTLQAMNILRSVPDKKNKDEKRAVGNIPVQSSKILTVPSPRRTGCLHPFGHPSLLVHWNCQTAGFPGSPFDFEIRWWNQPGIVYRTCACQPLQKRMSPASPGQYRQPSSLPHRNWPAQLKAWSEVWSASIPWLSGSSPKSIPITAKIPLLNQF